MSAQPRSQLEKYFQLVDAGNYDELLALFHPEVVYEREGHRPIYGADALRSFYLEGRQIASGRHTIDVIVANDVWAVAKGSFSGRLKDGTAVTVSFADFHEFDRGLIRRRFTFFAGEPI